MPSYILPVPLHQQFGYLLLLGLAVASVSWTVTHEEIFREPRDFCKDKSEKCSPLYLRKFFYLFTCEYCFSHYVAALFLLLTQFRMVCFGWRGYVIAELSLVWIANVYMSTFNRLRLDIKHEAIAIAQVQIAIATIEDHLPTRVFAPYLPGGDQFRNEGPSE